MMQCVERCKEILLYTRGIQRAVKHSIAGILGAGNEVVVNTTYYYSAIIQLFYCIFAFVWGEDEGQYYLILFVYLGVRMRSPKSKYKAWSLLCDRSLPVLACLIPTIILCDSHCCHSLQKRKLSLLKL